jgi:hypothetical protein
MVGEHHCKTPLQNTTAKHHCKTPLQNTTAKHHTDETLSEGSDEGKRVMKQILATRKRICAFSAVGLFVLSVAVAAGAGPTTTISRHHT